MALTLKAVLGMDTSGYELGINRATQKTDAFTKRVSTGVAANMGRLFSAAAVAVFAKSIVNLGSEFVDLARRTETSTDAIQQWIFAAKQSGSSSNTVVAFFEKLGDAREQALSGNEAMINSFARLGVSMRDLRTMRVEEIGLKIGNAVKAGDAQQLIGVLRDVGGKSAGELISAFKTGLESLFADAPLIKSEDLIDLEKAGDDIDALVLKIKTSFAPLIGFFAKFAQDAIDGLKILGKTVEFIIKGGPMGIGNAGAFKEYSDFLNKTVDAYSERRKEKAPSEATQSGMSGRESARKRGEFVDTFKEKEAAAIPAASKISQNINALQQIGARVAFDPMKNELQKNTAAIRELTGNLKVERIKGMGLTTRGGVQF